MTMCRVSHHVSKQRGNKQILTRKLVLLREAPASSRRLHTSPCCGDAALCNAVSPLKKEVKAN